MREKKLPIQEQNKSKISRFNFTALLSLAIVPLSLRAQDLDLKKAMFEKMKNKNGACVFIDGMSATFMTTDSTLANERKAPCSTFKIWNTVIGLETDKVSSPDELFYRWDGKKRFLETWNRDQTLKEAFQASCVPAYQNLARNIGEKDMKKWIDKIGYGDKDISSGIADFWLPVEGKKSIKISLYEQAQLLMKLVKGDLPLSDKTKEVMKEIMLAKETAHGSMYGKTGTDININGVPKLNRGWYTGYVTSGGKAYSFSIYTEDENIYGSDSKAVIESILFKVKLL